jgi:hypothetical protein
MVSRFLLSQRFFRIGRRGGYQILNLQQVIRLKEVE